MEPVKLLALDLDGTLLNSQKELTLRTRDALYAAAGASVEIVPTTGRFFTGMPEVIQKLPFLHFAITINGAQVYDIREKKAVSTAEIPLETALRVLEYLDGFPVIYDCYQDNWGWMTRSMQENAAAFVPIDHSLRTACRERRNGNVRLSYSYGAGRRKLEGIHCAAQGCTAGGTHPKNARAVSGAGLYLPARRRRPLGRGRAGREACAGIRHPLPHPLLPHLQDRPLRQLHRPWLFHTGGIPRAHARGQSRGRALY